MNATTKTEASFKVGDAVVMAEIGCDSEDDIGDVVRVGPGDTVRVRWSVADATYDEVVSDLVLSKAL